MNEQDPELTALRDLVQSEGWRVLTAHLEKEWGPAGFGWRIQHAIGDLPLGPDRSYEVARIAEQTNATAIAVNEIMTWPQERINALKAPQKPRGTYAALRRMGGR